MIEIDGPVVGDVIMFPVLVVSGVFLTASARFFSYLLSLPLSSPGPLPWNDYVNTVLI